MCSQALNELLVLDTLRQISVSSQPEGMGEGVGDGQTGDRGRRTTSASIDRLSPRSLCFLMERLRALKNIEIVKEGKTPRWPSLLLAERPS